MRNLDKSCNNSNSKCLSKIDVLFYQQRIMCSRLSDIILHVHMPRAYAVYCVTRASECKWSHTLCCRVRSKLSGGLISFSFTYNMCFNQIIKKNKKLMSFTLRKICIIHQIKASGDSCFASRVILNGFYVYFIIRGNKVNKWWDLG